MKQIIEVKPGQTWADCDYRMRGRTLWVVRTESGYAWCNVGATGRQTRIRLDRFRPTSTGFRLIRDENGKYVEE